MQCSFQQLIDLVLARLQWSHCLVYLDAVIILGSSFAGRLQNLQEVILRQIHDNGHLGQQKTLSRVKQKFYWPRHLNDIKNWCNICAPRFIHKTTPPKPKAALQTVQAGYLLQLVAVDIVVPFSESEVRNSYVLVMGEYFT